MHLGSMYRRRCPPVKRGVSKKRPNRRRRSCSGPPWPETPALNRTDVSILRESTGRRRARALTRHNWRPYGLGMSIGTCQISDRVPWIRSSGRCSVRHDDVHCHHLLARGARHRGPVLGLRQLRHPVQGVRQPGTPRDRRRRRSPTPRRCTGSPGWRRRLPCTSRGTWSTTSAALTAYAEELGVALGTINSNTFQDDDYKLGSLTHADPTVRREGRSSTTSTASRSWTRPARAT